MTTCRQCKTTWSGLRIAHCGTCHRTFTTPNLFDAHRARKYEGTGKGEKRVIVRELGQCYNPADDGMILNERGQWSMPGGDFDHRSLRDGAA